jgi:hypothetical protein
MKTRRSRRYTRAALHDWQHFDAERTAELDYIKAERAGIKIDNCPLGHSLKVEEFTYSFGPTGAIYSLIRLKGRWLSAIFPPNTRVVIEKGDNQVTLRKES